VAAEDRADLDSLRVASVASEGKDERLANDIAPSTAAAGTYTVDGLVIHQLDPPELGRIELRVGPFRLRCHARILP
jgi:hypothetical protein